MPHINFYLDKTGKKQKKLIFLYLRYSGKTFKYSTKEWILEGFWNKERQRARASKLFPIHEDFNRKLSRIETTAEEAYYQAFNKFGREPEPKEIKVIMDEKMNRSKPTKVVEDNVISYMKKYIEANSIRLADKRPLNNTYNLLVKVSTSLNLNLDFKEIDFDFYFKLLNYCIGKEYANKTTNNHIRRLKEVLRDAEDKGLKVNVAYRSRKFKKLKEVPATVVFLTPKEIELLYKVDLKDNPRLDRVRDVFIFGCCTGLRYSDLKKVKALHVDKKGEEPILNILTTKSLKPVSIPLHHYLKKILKKYNGKMPHVISSQKANQNIKQICRMAGVGGKIEVVKMIGSKLIRTPTNRVDKIASHTARRSFARNAYLSKDKIDIEQIRIILGHSSIKQTREYIRATELENAIQLMQNPFFTGKQK